MYRRFGKTSRKPNAGRKTSILDSVPRQMPALAYSQDIQRRVAQIGFDWENIDGVIEKLVEEVQEFKQTESRAERGRMSSVIFCLPW